MGSKPSRNLQGVGPAPPPADASPEDVKSSSPRPKPEWFTEWITAQRSKASREALFREQREGVALLGGIDFDGRPRSPPRYHTVWSPAHRGWDTRLRDANELVYATFRGASVAACGNSIRNGGWVCRPSTPDPGG